MIEFYAQARAVHVDAVLCSGRLFALRGCGVPGCWAAALTGNVGGAVGART